ncbi:uroporphyrinogen-III synthase [Polymorphum gilvum]|uniref:Uroporphyrinogen-III synthase n=1 Tax=Polymorphum gilvum (strain LMG 25793 / CGMCC 1.9160 / SL003B-26A1) TaxID=991905 RepID=F2J252_POLGS|nr:uroporphyrinogen-III synthase [Polymorphum gilvum]ADZ68811.1 Uroporphyrinogen-III synthase [Polymorphum gilvum SL003B-26A1]
MRFLVTRPQPDCARTAQRLRALGHEAVEAPLLAIVETPPESFDLSGVGALAVTSGRALAVLAGHRQQDVLVGLPLYAVGDRTAERARALGFATVIAAGGDVAALAERIAADGVRQTVLYPAARERAGDLEGLLAARGVACRTVEVYRSEPVDALPDAVAAALAAEAFDAVLVYSARTAGALAALLARAGPAARRPRVVAISAAAGAPLDALADVEAADRPDEAALIARALSAC